MTAPRQVLAGKTHLVTRRCSERRFFLRPSRLTNEIFLYVLAVAAKRCNILLHVACVLSNHYHVLVTDPDARLPEFEQYLDSLVARATNASLGRFEGFWAAATSYSAVALAGPEDIVAKAAYVLANPVAAGLVQTGSEWPGIWTSPDGNRPAQDVLRTPLGARPYVYDSRFSPAPTYGSFPAQKPLSSAHHLADSGLRYGTNAWGSRLAWPATF